MGDLAEWLAGQAALVQYQLAYLAAALHREGVIDMARMADELEAADLPASAREAAKKQADNLRAALANGLLSTPSSKLRLVTDQDETPTPA